MIDPRRTVVQESEKPNLLICPVLGFKRKSHIYHRTSTGIEEMLNLETAVFDANASVPPHSLLFCQIALGLTCSEALASTATIWVIQRDDVTSSRQVAANVESMA